MSHCWTRELHIYICMYEELSGEGGGRGDRMGNTCKSTADSCQCMTKTTTIL